MSETESEAKWVLNESAWLTLKKKLPLVESLRQNNLFFDNPEGRLRKEKWALRLRIENQKCFLTAKGPAEISGKIVHRPEIEVELHAGQAELFQAPFRLSDILVTPCEYLCDRFGDLELETFLGFDNHREVLSWEGFFLELDCSECLGHKRFELEWEAEADVLEKNLPRLEKWLQEEKIETKNSSMGKLSWALSLHHLL